MFEKMKKSGLKGHFVGDNAWPNKLEAFSVLFSYIESPISIAVH
jgi:hypothetical protein